MQQLSLLVRGLRAERQVVFVVGTPFANSHYETYTIQRRSTIFWDMRVSGVTYATVDWNASILGASDRVGLESYDANAAVPNHTYQSLRFALNDGALQPWAGFDTRGADPSMCGGTALTSGEHLTTQHAGRECHET